MTKRSKELDNVLSIAAKRGSTSLVRLFIDACKALLLVVYIGKSIRCLITPKIIPLYVHALLVRV